MTVAVLFGAQSFEHEISVVSAIALKKVLKCDIVYIFCDYERNFYLIPTDKITSKRFSSGEYKKDKTLFLKQGGFYAKKMLGEEKVAFDVMINLVHGRDGEDGKLSSMLDFFGVPYIGPRTEGSCISYNKLFTKLYAGEVGVNVLDYQALRKGSDELIRIPYPFIVKPLRLGSSIGIGIVKEKKELEYALDVAFEFDDTVLIEPFISGVKEYNLAGCKTDTFQFSIIEEPQKEEFLDFDKKYLDFSRTKRVNEATLDAQEEAGIKEAFERLYDPLFLGALIRCDFFVVEGKVYLNEINPIPGSMANYLFDDFDSVIKALSNYLPKDITMSKEYRYINSIQAAKGK
ncbi:D-alanine--D-alanine ligase [Sulfurospirillum multivorans]|uniref:D-alanine--D-alanine ligase n=2 Tax=Sulfurospirillum multivorans TaxID=66821 RepID=A0AA86DY36_SULMK|nr:D-alanine--D-alanine ligase [Sulfurospirillum multivorans]AHJ12738.1 D-alanine--D-alanine ligase [Sulfurospirillum multivorans DSM 12446]QEH06233.1 D-alanine--D-alanine ligase [Sulfurospirillum multivorans]